MPIEPVLLRTRAALIERESPGWTVDVKYLRQAADEIERLGEALRWHTMTSI